MDDDDDKQDGRGQAPGSAKHRFKRGTVNNPNGRPVGSKGVLATMKKALLGKAEWLGDGKKSNIEAIVEGSAKHVYKGDSRYLDLMLEMMTHLSRIEQVRENSAASDERHLYFKRIINLYSLQDINMFDMDPQDLEIVREVADLIRRKPKGYEQLIKELREPYEKKKKD